MTRISDEISISQIIDIQALTSFNIEDITAGSFYACKYENDWFIGVVKFVSMENDDVMFKFMHPKGFATHHFWPQRNDECWVPLQNILMKLSVPTSTLTGRNYSFDSAELNLLRNMFKS